MRHLRAGSTTHTSEEIGTKENELNNWALIEQLDTGSSEKSVWHYTSPEAFISILKTDEIWASSPSHVNDSTEMSFAQDILFEYWEQYATAQMKSSSFMNSVMDRTFYDLNRTNVYFFSGAKYSNLLNLWVQYAGSGGVAIEFDTSCKFQHSDLDPAEVDQDDPIGLIYPDWYDVEYGREYMTRKYLDFVRWLTELELMNHLTTQTRLDAARVNLISHFLKVKHEGFSTESEIRFVTASLDLNLSKFRTLKGKVVPYVPLKAVQYTKDKFQFGKLPILSVVCAPGASASDRDGVVGLLKSCGHDVPVTISDIPYLG